MERGQKQGSKVTRSRDKTLILTRHMLSVYVTVLPAEHKHESLMRKDQMGYYGDLNQFQSNKIAEISLFVQMKYSLTNDKPAMKTIKRSYPDATDAATFNPYEFLCRWEEIQHELLMYVISVTQRCFPYRLQELIYTASAITGAQLIFSSFHYTFLSCSQIALLEICQENYKMFSLQTTLSSSG